MFEGLKDTLGRFREDVEEEIDEEAAEDGSEEAESEAEDAEEGGRADDAGAADEADDAARDAEAAGDAVEEQPNVEASDRDGEPADEDQDPTDDGGSDDEDPAELSEDESGADEEEASDGDDESGNGERAGFATRARAAARGRVVIDEDDIEGALRDLELALLGNDVEMEVAETIIERVREELVGETRRVTHGTGSVAEEALREALLSVVGVGQFDFEARIREADGPALVVFTGVNGVGKTTTIAKLSRYLEERGYSSVLANGDTYRAGANEQLREHADRLDRTLIAHEQGGDPAAVIYDAVEYAEANDVDVVLGDTAGRLHTNEDLMNQLEKIDRVVDPDVTLFVDEAVAGQDAVRRARQFDEAAAIDGAILTKADADASGGAAISIAHVTGKPILFLGVGQEYDDLEVFDPEELVDRLLEE